MRDAISNGYKRPRSLLALAGFGAAAASAAWFGARYTGRQPNAWYAKLDKPPFTPPPSVFPLVWTALYATMAWSAWRVYNAPASRARSQALQLWFLQLSTNAEWSKLFFRKRRPDLALGDSVLLATQILRYMSLARRVDRAAANAFLPYLGWVGFATVLNAEIVRRNS